MSAKVKLAANASGGGTFRAIRVALCGTLLAGCLGQVQAQSFMEIATPSPDPLHTRPPLLSSGPKLPGDQERLVCVPWDGHDLRLQSLTLLDVIDIGLCANPQVQGAWAAIKVQAAALGEAQAAFFPTVSAGLSYTHDRTNYPGSGRDPSIVEGSGKNVGLGWRVFDFGGRAASKASAVALLDAAMASHSAALQKTLETLIGAYFDAQTALASWQAKQKAEVLARSTLQTVQRRESHGAGSQTDTLQAMAAVAKASLDKSRALGDYQKSLSMLVYAMGLPSTTTLQLKVDVQDDNHVLTQDLQTWLEQTQHSHPAIVAALAQLQSAREKVTATQSEGLPNIDFSANVYQNGRPGQGLSGTDTTEKVVAFTLNVPLFEGFSRTYKVRGAQAQVEQSQASLDDVTHQVLMDVVKTYADAQSALGNLDASDLLLSSAQNALDSVQRKFDRGASDILEMLNAQATLTDAQAQRIRCLAEWRSARLRLLASAGVLGRAAIER